MTTELANLKPYISLMLSRTMSGRDGRELVTEVLSDIKGVLGLQDSEGPLRLISRDGPVLDRDLTVGFMQYQEQRSPGWTSGPDLKDTINQLVLVCLRHRHVAILLTDPGRCRAIAERFSGGGTGLSALEAIKPGILNAAFAGGPARTLWLSGIHTRTIVKADSKVLTGMDLRYALDPLGDQSYYFTAARCVTDLGIRRAPVGLSPRRSRVWIGPSRSWGDFRDCVVGVLKHLETIEKAKLSEEAPLPVLATPVSKPKDVRDAFDMSVIAPEVAAEDVADPVAYQKHERWAYEAKFEVVSVEGANLEANVFLNATLLGKVKVQVDITDPKHISYEITSESERGQEELLQEAVHLCKNRRWLQIRYESGHTLSEGVIYSPRFRDVRFENWAFPDFGRFDIHIDEEKPTEKKGDSTVFVPEAVGSKKSLFCWVWNNWPCLDGSGQRQGWLACDDGSMEIADFIHLDTAQHPSLLSIIHVKGSHSSEAARGISVSDYEVVTAQAIKNLRYLDRIILDKGLEQGVGKRIGKLVWHDGIKQPDRKEMLAALRKARESYRRRVVVIQPRLSQRELKAARAEKEGNASSGRAIRLLQLETLLVGAEAVCRSLQAGFLVVADGTPVSGRPISTRPTPRRRAKQGGVN